MPRSYQYTTSESSKVKEISYDPETQRLSVVFHNTERFRYHYPGVPPETVCKVMFGRSVGSNMVILVTKPWGDNFEKEDLAEAKDGPTFGGSDA